MAKDILKEAIADAKAVREVALANAKAALEEAFTPRLQSMLSAKLSEELDEGEDKEEIEETYMEDKEEMDESYMEGEKEDLDEEIDLEEILSELELDEAKDEDKDMKEGKDEADEDMKEGKMKDADKDMKEGKDEADEDMKEGKKKEDLDEMEVNYKAETANRAGYAADYVHEGNENFDLDALLEEINNLDENEDEVNEGDVDELSTMQKIGKAAGDAIRGTTGGVGSKSGDLVPLEGESFEDYQQRVPNSPWIKWFMADDARIKANFSEGASVYEELEETQSALETVRTELNEVNLLNSKLLYVNRIFKANNLNEGQKLRVVETLDNASNIKEAKLIYETIKDTFTVANAKKASFKSKTKSIHEGLGMASKAAGTSTAPKKEVITEANDMVSRMQKLANIKIN